MKTLVGHFKKKNMKLDKNYCIRDDYQIRNYTKFLDTSTRTDEFQNDVYSFAKKIALNDDVKTVADVGCGSAYKLFKFFKNYDIIGYELETTVSMLKKRYPKNKWVVSDFNKVPQESDLVICADVIEHVMNPDELIFYIKKMNFKHLIISTPDRDLMHNKLGRPYLGPPNNKHHVREWSFKEFEKYISQFFSIKEHFKIEKEYGQVIHCLNG